VNALAFAAGVSVCSLFLCTVLIVQVLRALRTVFSFCVLDQSVGVQVSDLILVVMGPKILWSYDKFAIHTHTHTHTHRYVAIY
jgi:hypothetical protein